MLGVFYNNEETAKLEDCGVSVDMEDFDVRNRWFYRVSSIGEHREGSGRYVSLCSDGERFIIAGDFKENVAKINEWVKENQ